MKNKIKTLSLSALLAGVASIPAAFAGEAVVSSDGAITLSLPDLRLAPVVYAFNWETKNALVSNPDHSTNEFAIKIDGDNSLLGKIAAQSSTEGAVQVDYALTSEADCKVDSVCISADIRASNIGGGTWVADQETGAVPREKTEKVHLFIGKVSRFTLSGPEAKTFAFELNFPRPTYILLQDSRKWGGDFFTLRIHPDYESPLVKGRSYPVSFSIKGLEPMKIVQDGLVTIAAGTGEWLPLKQSLDIRPGSALDFSNLTAWHAPAGEFGRLIAEGSHFAFEKLPGKPQRFYGANLCFSANYLEGNEPAQLASRFRRIGYNTVRLHHHDNTLVEGSADKTTLNPKRLDQLDRLMAAFVTNGIYVTTDMFVSRSIPWRTIGIDKDGDIPCNDFKLLCAVNEGAMDNWKRFTRQFLEHVNPYTGRSYAQEPALAWLSLVNEGNLGNFVSQQKSLPEYPAKWKTWLEKKRLEDASYSAIPETIPENIYAGGAHTSAYMQFLDELERAMAKTMKDFIQNELKCKALVTNANGWTQKLSGQTARSDVYDYVDDHFYIDHPNFLEKPWSLPSRCPNSNPFKNDDMGMRASAFSRAAGKPFTVSEFNFSAPGRYRGVGGIATGAIAALQDWSVLWRFAYSHGREGMFKPMRIGYFNVSEDPLMLASERASLCLFLRGDAKPLAKTLTIVIPRDVNTRLQREGMPSVNPSWTKVAWETKVQTAMEKSPADSTWSIASSNAYSGVGSAEARGLVADEPFGGGMISVDDGKGTFVINTPRTIGGFTEGGTIAAGVLNAEILDTPATLWISALDGRPCESSDRMLLTHLTDIQNTNMKYAEKARRTLLSWGELPHLVQRGRAKVGLKLDNPATITVYAISTSGERLDKVASQVNKGALEFIADTGLRAGDATLLYELAREK